MLLRLYFALSLLCSSSTLAVAGGFTLSPLEGEAPGFELLDIDGNTVRLSDFRGQALVVNFWATWCLPCRQELPSMERGSRWLEKQGGRFVTINMGEKPEAIQRFLKRSPIDLPMLLDPDIEISTQWGVTGLPATFVVDPEGRFAFKVLGPREWDDPALLVPIRALTLKKTVAE
ncbi:MAG: TlpA family protein disulfide reductase [Gammaproteobacteria bacterium]|nr:TlpA family protein disulfide reductase [Gammaproteobacteria bacterium]